MVKTIITSFVLALTNIRSRFFHTLLSVLGIVIGVAALVSILSLIDGMEKYANEQIASTTSLNGIIVSTDQYKYVNNVRVAKDTVRIIPFEKYQSLHSMLTKSATTYFRSSFSEEIRIDSSKSVGASVLYTDTTLQPVTGIAKGRSFSSKEILEKAPVVVVNKKFAEGINKDTPNAVIGTSMTIRGEVVSIIGITDENTDIPQCYLPITLLSASDIQAHPPGLIVEAETVTDVPVLKEDISGWLKSSFPKYHDEFRLVTNELRLEQAAKGFLLFRIIMGLIVGISVLVGGIGVMNVLLISVTERTTEIGIRKAIGAKRRDITLQFLSESVTVSAFGSIVGVILGVLATMAFVPIVKALTKIPFQAAYTANTLMVISVVALAVGIIFGTYPAMRASRLDPVDAIRQNS